jgi:sulfur-carrier protein
MHIKVRLFASLKRFAPDDSPGKTYDLELPDKATILDLSQHLHLPPDEVKISFVNGRAREDNWVLNEGDEVGLFPPIGGG